MLDLTFLSPSTAFSLDTEQPDYDLDSEDDVFVNKLKKKLEVGALQFEEMIDRLEKGSGQQVIKKFGFSVNYKTASGIAPDEARSFKMRTEKEALNVLI